MQTVLVVLVIAAAGFYLGRMIYLRFFSKKTGCDGCALSPKGEES